MLDSKSVDEWSAYLDGLVSVNWDDEDTAAFMCSLLLFLMPRRWMRAMEAAVLSDVIHRDS